MPSTAYIPFQFSTGKTTLPAGEYKLTCFDPNGRVVLIASTDGKAHAAMQMIPVRNRSQDGDKLVPVMQPGTMEAYQKAIDLDMKACQQDNKSDACIQAGDLYAKYANDQVAANLLYRKACNLDNATGCNKVAVLYENGIGIPRNAR